MSSSRIDWLVGGWKPISTTAHAAPSGAWRCVLEPGAIDMPLLAELGRCLGVRFYKHAAPERSYSCC